MEAFKKNLMIKPAKKMSLQFCNFSNSFYIVSKVIFYMIIYI